MEHELVIDLLLFLVAFPLGFAIGVANSKSAGRACNVPKRVHCQIELSGNQQGTQDNGDKQQEQAEKFEAALRELVRKVDGDPVLLKVCLYSAVLGVCVVACEGLNRGTYYR
jgi:hypothetical protein